MAIADTITSMQTHTSNAYTMLSYGTDLTGINKNLENLSSTIFNAFLEALRTPDTLFTNLPKKSGTGANITLNDTANAPMRITLKASELSQDGTPTPSTPQDIHTISGSNKVVVSDGNGNSQEANIDLGNIEYCKIGDYEDRIFKNVVGDTDYSSERDNGGWYLKKNIGKVQLSDSWNWYVQSTNHYQISMLPSSGAYKIYLARTGVGLSNYFAVKTSGTDVYLYPILETGGTDYIRISNAVNQWSTLADFKTWLSNNNVEFYYPTSTPTYTKITGTLETQLNNIYKNMLSYKGTTNVSQINNDLPFVLGVSAIQDLE